MEVVMMELDRGDICLVNFNPAKGGEIGEKLSKLNSKELFIIQDALCQILV